METVVLTFFYLVLIFFSLRFDLILHLGFQIILLSSFFGFEIGIVNLIFVFWVFLTQAMIITKMTCSVRCCYSSFLSEKREFCFLFLSFLSLYFDRLGVWNSMHAGGGEQGDGGREGGTKAVGADAAVEAGGAPPQSGGDPQRAQGPHSRVPCQRDCQACEGCRHWGNLTFFFSLISMHGSLFDLCWAVNLKVVRSGDLVSYTAEEGVRILGEGKLLVSDSFPGNERSKYCLSSKVNFLFVFFFWSY